MKKYRVRTPTRNVIREKKARKSFPCCGSCGEMMHGMPNCQCVSKTEKRPERAYGGYLCACCTKELFREKARSI